VPIEWTGLGPEVLLRLDRGAGEPLRDQLERELRNAIRSGRLGPGERLPSSRKLASELGVSRGLVLECYAQLQAEGFLSSRSGSATRVAAGAQPPATSEAPTSEASRPRRSQGPRLAVDFCAGVPDLTSFPRSDWAWALRESCRRASVAELGYGDPRGAIVLREVLAAYIRRVRGALAEPERIVVCTGFQQGLGLVLQALARAGVRCVAREDPGDDEYGAIAERAGVEAVAVPVDERGIDVDALVSSGAQAVILTPTHQFPTGVALAPERRQALVAWAAERDATILEDDYDAEFRYDREPVGALQALAPDRVALLGTVSKSLAPALRIAWVVCPPGLAQAVAEEKRLADRGSPTLEQLALAALIASGRFDRHLRHMRRVYAGRRDALVHALEEHAPVVQLSGLAAGFHAVAQLPQHADEPAVIAKARDRSIGLYGVSRFRADPRPYPSQLVLGFGNLTESAIERGIATVGDLLRAG
jgi:GntR family transcriptional regulator/MocR family aminotransferase